MIKIFGPTEKNFKTNGLKVLFPISCTEYKKKSLNGWSIETEFKIKDKEWLVKDNIIAVKTKSKLNPQGFRIDKIEEHTQSIIITANHVMFDAENYYLEDVRPTELSAGNALIYINERTDIESPFSFSSDINNINTQYVIDKNLLQAMSLIEERWGGSFDADNYNIFLRKRVGNDNGEIIRQKKNLVSRVISEDWSNVTTKLYPKGPDGLKLPEKFLESDVQYKIPYTRNEDFDFDIDDQMSEDDKIIKLRDLGKKFLEENKYPKVCYELEANLQNVEIGDRVQVIDASMNLITEIQEYEYDLNTKKIKNIVFGNYTKNVKEKFNNIKDSIVNVINTISKQQAIINHQTELINNLNKNGIIKITENEMLIVDKLPIESAKNVWRWGLGGLGFSSNGYEGPFETAITMDGHINANFITAGKMSTERIEGFEQLLLTVSKTQQFTEEKTSTKKLIIENAQAGNLLGLSITGEMELLFPSDDLYPVDDLYPLDSYLNIEDLEGNIRQVLLPIAYLYKKDNVSDEFVLERIYNDDTKKYESKCKIIRRISVDSEGNKSIVTKETIEELGIVDIPLWKGINKIYLESFEGMNYSCKYTIINEITDEYATHTELSTAINMTESKIDQIAKLKVDSSTFESYRTQTAKLISEKVSDDDFESFRTQTSNNFSQTVQKGNIISSFNQSAETIKLDSSKIDLKAADILTILSGNTINMTTRNITISSTNFSVDKDGKITAKSGTIGPWNITTTSIYKGSNEFGKIGDGNIYFGNNGLSISNTFKVTAAGVLTATGANITGNITASSGSIGGWTISGDSLYKKWGNYEIWMMPGTNDNHDFLSLHNISNDSWPFYLRADGTLSSTRANITGTISGSTIKGSTINGSSIVGGSIKIESTGFFAFGTGTTHPWASAVNVTGIYGINFYNGTSVSSIGSQQGYIDMGGSNGALQVVSIHTDVVLGGYHVKLNPRSGGTAYVVTSSGGTYAISTTGGNLSSLNLKENLEKFNEEEYQKAYDLLKKIDFYRFDYKYQISKNQKEYGFIIDYIEKNKDYDKFLYFKNEHAKVLKNKEFDYSAKVEEAGVINFKKYDQENLSKFLMASLKAIQNEVEKMKEKFNYERQ